MVVELSDREVVTEPCRLAFPSLFEPKPRFKGSDRETYQAVVLLPPEVDKKPFVNAIKAAMLDKWGKLLQLRSDKNPLRECGEKSTIDGYEEGWHYINTHSGYAPGLVDQKRQEVIDREKFYAGCWCRFHLTAYAWEHPTGGKGVSFSLNAVQFVKDDDRLDGRKKAADVFDAIEVEDGDAELFADRSEDSDDVSAIFG